MAVPSSYEGFAERDSIGDAGLAGRHAEVLR